MWGSHQMHHTRFHAQVEENLRNARKPIRPSQLYQLPRHPPQYTPRPSPPHHHPLSPVQETPEAPPSPPHNPGPAVEASAERPSDDGNADNYIADPFYTRIFKEAWKDAFILLRDPTMQSIVGSEVNIATLQRVNIHAIQREIVQLTGRFVKNRELKENDIVVLRTLMKDYCTAWRDWDLMLERTATADKDPFRISTNNKLSQKLMHEAGLLNQETIGEILASENPRSPIGFKKPHSLQLPAGGRHAKLLDEQVKEATLRFTWAVGAGLFLLLPVLIMSLLPTLIISLIVTSLSVFLFAFTASFISAGLVPGLNLKDFGVKDILASTLAYAAVLVVFVGTSVQQQTSNTASA